jgi:hypothetical protein
MNKSIAMSIVCGAFVFCVSHTHANIITIKNATYWPILIKLGAEGKPIAQKSKDGQAGGIMLEPLLLQEAAGERSFEKNLFRELWLQPKSRVIMHDWEKYKLIGLEVAARKMFYQAMTVKQFFTKIPKTYTFELNGDDLALKVE